MIMIIYKDSESINGNEMNVLAINVSPRIDGNTSLALNEMKKVIVAMHKDCNGNTATLAAELLKVFQGAAPEKWMLEAGEYTMKRFAALYRMTYGGMATNKNEASRFNKTL